MFTQPDTIIPDPGNSMDWNRYAYVNYNPINFSDPTGHAYWGGDDYDPADVHDDGMPMEEALLRQQFRAAAQRMWKNREDYILWDVEVDGPGVNLGTPPYPRIHEEDEIWPWFKDEDTGLFVEVNIFEYAGSSIPIVCTDVPYLLYLEIGIYIDESIYSPEAFASGYDGSGSVYSENSIMRGSSSVDRYFDMVKYNGGMSVHSGDVFRGDGYHVGAVVNVDDATDPNKIYVMHTSTSQNGLYIHTLADLMGYFSTIEFGYFQEH